MARCTGDSHMLTVTLTAGPSTIETHPGAAACGYPHHEGPSPQAVRYPTHVYGYLYKARTRLGSRAGNLLPTVTAKGPSKEGRVAAVLPREDNEGHIPTQHVW